MPRTLRTLLLGTIALTALSCAARGIVWQESIEDALGLSARTGKPVLVYFTYHG
jgi:hypothetical protein